ncbi:condensation domain-containing protein [Desulfosporosinus shakirovi]|uniref:condensation domain-containing protein n=1 Tax=Desulfosporosinus shakirovi TaxID=2885154 RepID=UPI001E613E18|nr:condensation domain-containing protein [Desulfosporosinus sp. SRJS8]MCB8816719.1 condensation domain-containing protein [Desulfosporosinus sp. SRJS8]
MNRFKEMAMSLNSKEKKFLIRAIREHGEDYNIYPLSSEQARMWYLYNLDRKNPYYNVPISLHIQGKPDMKILNKTLKAIMQRHKVLTTKIVSWEGEAFQYLSEELCPDLIPEWIEEGELEEKIAAEINTPFDLEEEVPVRFRLFQREADRYHLHVCIHHMFIDGWSIKLFYKEFKDLYRAFAGEESYVPEIPAFQYGDYAKRDYLRERTKEKTYWLGQLEKASFYLNLPLNQPRRKSQDTQGTFFRYTVADKAEISRLCKKYKLSVFSFFLSVYYLTLRKCCAQNNLTVGTPILNRNSEELNSLMGYFSNSIPLNVRIQGQESLEEFFRTVGQRVMEGLDHGALPFDRLVDLLAVKRRGEENPVFQVMFSLHNNLLLGSACEEKEKLENLGISLDTGTQGAGVQFDMLCTVIEKEDHFELDFALKKALFSPAGIEDICEAYQTILKEILAGDEQRIDDYGRNIRVAGEYSRRLADLILEQSVGISDCRVQLNEDTCLVYYLSPSELENKYFRNILAPWMRRRIIALRLPGYPLTAEGEVDSTFLRETCAPYLENMLAALAELRKRDPEIDWDEDADVRFHIDKEKPSFYPRADLSAGAEWICRDNWGQGAQKQGLAKGCRPAESPAEQLTEGKPLPEEFPSEESLAGESPADGSPVEKLLTQVYLGERSSVKESPAEKSPVKESLPEGKSVLAGSPLKELPYKTLVDMLLLPREDEGNLRKITTINSGKPRKEFSYLELLARAKTVAGNLQSLGIQAEDKIILEINPLDEFIQVFWGCLLAGATVIPLDIPADLSVDEGSPAAARFMDIAQVSGFPRIIADETLKGEFSKLPGIDKKRILLSQDLLTERWGDYRRVCLEESTIALMLFTSGSTGIPKGVMLSHRNVLKRSQGTILHNHFHDREISLNWMPLSHVGGIVMFHILDTVNRAEQIQVETRLIIEDPLRWLLLLAEFKVTNTWAPNFAYGLITEQREGVKELEISLTSLKFILNGGEAINYNSCHEFMTLLGEKGLSYSAMKPSWGMTETSSGVLFSDHFGKLLYKNSVAVGKPIPGVKIRIVAEDGTPVDKGQRGRLQISGETVNQGYYMKPEETEKSFTQDHWFDSGDFALLLEDEVVITGRAKEIVIVNGLNHSCLEIEKSLEELPEILTGTVGCTAIPNPETNEDEICIFYGENPGSQREGFKEAVARQLLEHFGVNYRYLVPVKGEDIPRTSIGKIEKHKLVKQLQEGKLTSIALEKDKGVPRWFAKAELVRKNILRLEAGSPRVKIFSSAGNKNLALEIQGSLGQGGFPGSCQGGFPEFCQGEIVDFKNLRLSDITLEQSPLKASAGSKDPVDLKYSAPDLTIPGCGIYLAGGDSDPSGPAVLLADLAQISDILKANRNETKPLRLLVLSHYEEDYHSLLAGFCSSIPLEYENIAVKCITYTDPSCLLAQLKGEVLAADMKHKKFEAVKYLMGARFVEVITSELLLQQRKTSPPFQAGGQYILIGGLGGIGRELSRRLLTNYGCSLILIGRTKLEDSPGKRQDLARLQELGEVSYHSLDVGMEGRLKGFLQQIYGQGRLISGIISLVGEEKSGLHFAESDPYGLANLTKEQMEAIIRPRLTMMAEIDEFLLDKEGIRVLVFSSAAAFFGGRTYSAYAGISSYLYHFQLRNPANSYWVLAWSKWKNIGMSAGESKAERLATEQSGYHIIDLLSGFCSLEGLLARGYTRAIVGLDLKKDSLANYREVAAEFKDLQLEIVYHHPEEEGEPDLPTYKGVRIQKLKERAGGKSDALNPTERKLISVWAQVLRQENIKVTDNFFSIGGNSLKSIKLVAEMNALLGRSLSIVDLFTYSSIRAMAAYLNRSHVPEQEAVMIEI